MELQPLLAAHPDGMEIQSELGIAASTLSHHLEKLKNEDLITVRREHISSLYRQHRDLGGTAGVPVRRVLHPEQSH